MAAIRRRLTTALDVTDADGRKVGDARFGVYAFYDYDGEPIYVGQTYEKIRTRIRRHLTNQRTDAVAMNVLDPFEVADIEMWPFFELEDLDAKDPRIRSTLDSAEYTVFQKVLGESSFHAVLNEKEPRPTEFITLPDSYRERIIPDEFFDMRRHPDTRLARRASTIASLARVISERQVSPGLRWTLLTQARRLTSLAERRLIEIEGGGPVVSGPDLPDVDE